MGLKILKSFENSENGRQNFYLEITTYEDRDHITPFISSNMGQALFKADNGTFEKLQSSPEMKRARVQDPRSPTDEFDRTPIDGRNQKGEPINTPTSSTNSLLIRLRKKYASNSKGQLLMNKTDESERPPDAS